MPPTIAKDRHATGSADWVADQIQRQLREEGVYAWIRDVMVTRNEVIASNDYGHLLSIPYEIEDGAVVMGEPAEVGVEYVIKAMPDLALAGPIVGKQEERRVVIGPVLVPDEPDTDGDVVSKEQIERVAHLWMQKYQNIDLQHTLNNVSVPVESYIAPADLEFPGGTIPEGSWVLATRVPDELWSHVEKGELTGFSLMAVEGDDLALAVKGEADITAAWKRTTLADLGDDWVVPFVSLVDTPAVPKARWVAVKRAAEATQEPSSPKSAQLSLGDKLRAMFSGGADGSADKEGRRFSNATYNQLKSAVEALSALLDEAEKERKDSKKEADEVDQKQVQEMIDTSLSSALTPVTDAIKSLTDALSKSNGDEGSAPAADAKADDAPAEASKQEPSEREQELETKLADAQKELEELQEAVEKRLATVPKSLTGQDGDGDAPAGADDDGTYTDAFGERYRRDAAGRARRVA